MPDQPNLTGSVLCLFFFRPVYSLDTVFHPSLLNPKTKPQPLAQLVLIAMRMKKLFLVTSILLISLNTFANLDDKSGNATDDDRVYCSQGESEYSCKNRACEGAKRNAEAKAESLCSSYGGLKSSYSSGYESSSLQRNGSEAHCSVQLRYECER